MAAPPAALFLASLQAFGVATQADLAPLATQLNALAAQVAALPTQAQLNALAAQVAALPTQAQLNALAAQVAALPTLAQIQATIAAALAPHNAPAVAAAASAVALDIADARRRNKRDDRGVAFAVVPRSDGTPPPNWPPGFDRDALVEGPIAAVDGLLGDYGLPNGAPAALFTRRNALARHIGTPRA